MSSYQEGMDAYERGDYDTALKELRPLAEQGHVGAQSLLGSMYDQGKGAFRQSILVFLSSAFFLFS